MSKNTKIITISLLLIGVFLFAIDIAFFLFFGIIVLISSLLGSIVAYLKSKTVEGKQKSKNILVITILSILGFIAFFFLIYYAMVQGIMNMM